MRILFQVTLLVGFLLSHVLAAEADDFSAVRLADRQRIDATLAGDAAKLSVLLSDDLKYMHADGRVQTKTQFVAAATGNTTKYLSVEPREISLQSIVPGAVAMIGRAHIAVMAGPSRLEFDLQFLAIWREEAGHWRMLLYQSTQLRDAVSGPIKK